MKNYCTLFFLFVIYLFFSITKIPAQDKKTAELSPEVRIYTVPEIELWPEDRYSSYKEALIDNKIFFPLVYRGGLFPKFDYKFSLDSVRLTEKAPIPFVVRSPAVENLFKHFLIKKNLEDRIYRNVFLKNLEYFEYTLDQLPKDVIKYDINDRTVGYIELNTTPTHPNIKSIDNPIKIIPDRKYWRSSFSTDIKFSQNKTSANWFKGEINNMNIFTNSNISYNYARDKISLTNTLSTTFTISNALNDSIRKYAIGSDELRLRSNFGLKAIGHWDYSASAEFITSMGNKYISNTNTKNSAFLSPYTINSGVGMTYKLNPQFKSKYRSLNLSLSIEPFSIKYMYSTNKNINLASYFPKNENGDYEYILRTFGSTILMTNTIKFNRSISLYSRLYYFSNYDRVICEFENKLDYDISRFFSTTLYLYLRYDDGVAKNANSDTFLQVNELFSFGFSYKW